MELSNTEKAKLIKEAFECLGEIESILSSVDKKLSK